MSACLYDITERQLHNNSARGINIQLHAHQSHINNCWGINCVVIPTPMVEFLIQRGPKSAQNLLRSSRNHSLKEFFRGRPRRGATLLYFTSSSAPDPLFKGSKARILTLRVGNSPSVFVWYCSCIKNPLPKSLSRCFRLS